MAIQQGPPASRWALVVALILVVAFVSASANVHAIAPAATSGVTRKCRAAFGQGCLKCTGNYSTCIKCRAAYQLLRSGSCGCKSKYGAFVPSIRVPAWQAACANATTCTCRKCPRAAPLGIGGSTPLASCYRALRSQSGPASKQTFGLDLTLTGACMTASATVLERLVSALVQGLPGVTGAVAQSIKCAQGGTNQAPAAIYSLIVTFQGPADAAAYMIASAKGVTGPGTRRRRLLAPVVSGAICATFPALCDLVASELAETVINSIGFSSQALPTAAAPTAPTGLATSSAGTESWSATWLDGEQAGDPRETYTLKCVAGGGKCSDAAFAGSSPASGVARGVQAASVTGLTAGSTYTCYVAAINWLTGPAGLCSAGVQVTTTRGATLPSSLLAATVNATSADFVWTDGAVPAVPPETMLVKCFEEGGACGDKVVAESPAPIPRGTQAATISGLQPSTTYTCYIAITTLAGNTCSNGIDITTLLAPVAPTALAALPGADRTTSANFTWTDGVVAGTPAEKLRVRCVTPGGACTDAPLAESSLIDRGVQNAVVTVLVPATAYTCFVIARNTAGTVCSGSIDIVTLRRPATPTALATTAIGDTSAAFSWTDGNPAGVPAETVLVRCVAPGGACTDTPVAESPAVARSTLAASIATGLDPGTDYTCYAVASSTLSFACSSPLLVTTTLGTATGVSIAVPAASLGRNELEVSFTAPVGAANCTVTILLNSTTYGGPQPQVPGPKTVLTTGSPPALVTVAYGDPVEYFTNYGVSVVCKSASGVTSAPALASNPAKVGGLPGMSLASDRQFVGERDVAGTQRSLQGIALAPDGSSYYLGWIGTTNNKWLWQMDATSTPIELGLCYPQSKRNLLDARGWPCYDTTTLAVYTPGGASYEVNSVASDDKGRVYAVVGAKGFQILDQSLTYITEVDSAGDAISGIHVTRVGPTTLHVYVTRGYLDRIAGNAILQRFVATESGNTISAVLDGSWANGGTLSLAGAPYSASGANNVVVDVDGTIYVSLKVGPYTAAAHTIMWKVARIPAADAAANTATSVVVTTVPGAWGLALYRSRLYVTQNLLHRSVAVLNKHTLELLTTITDAPQTRVNVTETGFTSNGIGAGLGLVTGFFELDVSDEGVAYVNDMLWRFFPATTNTITDANAYQMNKDSGGPFLTRTRLYMDRVLSGQVW